jgi:hypothetical protein
MENPEIRVIINNGSIEQTVKSILGAVLLEEA